jgi:hypothetical protein
VAPIPSTREERQANELGVALQHIETRVNLLLLASDDAHRVRIMKAMTELELIEWNPVIRSID